MENPITALLFIKKNSERVPGKNFRLFNGKPLFTIMLDRLDKMNCFEKILVNSDSAEVLEYVSKNLKKGISIERPAELMGDTISANELIAHDIQFSSSEHFFQTHVTNPLLTEKTISSSIKRYFELIGKNDSLFSVRKIQNRVYGNSGAAINHNMEKMLRTQDLKPVFEENSCFFIFSRNSFLLAKNNRVGVRPSFFEIANVESLDIDHEEDFLLAELIDRNKNCFPETFVQST